MSEALEPIVLDADGKVLHNPNRPESPQGPQVRIIQWNGTGLLPKILMGTLFGGLLLLGLTVAGIILGVVFIGFIVRLLFFPKPISSSTVRL